MANADALIYAIVEHAKLEPHIDFSLDTEAEGEESINTARLGFLVNNSLLSSLAADDILSKDDVVAALRNLDIDVIERGRSISISAIDFFEQCRLHQIDVSKLEKAIESEESPGFVDWALNIKNQKRNRGNGGLGDVT